MPGRQEVRRHLRLAKGFIESAVIRDDSNEFEIRNALSRSYYGLFHACHSWLALRNVPFSKRSQHEMVIKEIGDRRGKEFGERLNEFWSLRKQADYDRPELLRGRYFPAAVNRLRLSARGDCDRMAAEMTSYVLELDGLE